MCWCYHTPRRWESCCRWLDCATYSNKAWSAWLMQDIPQCLCYTVNIPGIPCTLPHFYLNAHNLAAILVIDMIFTDKRHAYSDSRPGHIKAWFCLLLGSPDSPGILFRFILHIAWCRCNYYLKLLTPSTPLSNSGCWAWAGSSAIYWETSYHSNRWVDNIYLLFFCPSSSPLLQLKWNCTWYVANSEINSCYLSSFPFYVNCLHSCDAKQCNLSNFLVHVLNTIWIDSLKSTSCYCRVNVFWSWFLQKTVWSFHCPEVSLYMGIHLIND